MKIEQLIAWLSNEERETYGASRTHDLHLWDWEVSALLNELRQMSAEPTGQAAVDMRACTKWYNTCNFTRWMNRILDEAVRKPLPETGRGGE